MGKFWGSLSRRTKILLLAVIASVAAISVIIALTISSNGAPEELEAAPGDSVCEVVLKTHWLPVDMNALEDRNFISARLENEQVMMDILNEFSIGGKGDENISRLANELHMAFIDLTVKSTAADIMSSLTKADATLRTLNSACVKAGFPKVEISSMVKGVNDSVQMAIPTNTEAPVQSHSQMPDPNKFQPFMISTVGVTRPLIGECGKQNNLCLDVEIKTSTECPGGVFVDVVFKGKHSNAPIDSQSITTKRAKAEQEFTLHFESDSPKAGNAELVDILCIGGQ